MSHMSHYHALADFGISSPEVAGWSLPHIVTCDKLTSFSQERERARERVATVGQGLQWRRRKARRGPLHYASTATVHAGITTGIWRSRINKMNLAARSGAKLSFPQKAGFMFQNLSVPQAQKESLINGYVLRSQKQLPLKISAMQYSTVSLDKVGALVTQTQNGGNVSNDVLQSLMNSVNQTQQQLNQSQTNLIQTTKHLQVSEHMQTFVGLRDRKKQK